MICSAAPAGQGRRNALVILAAAALLFPGYSSVLCIGPGGHVAIEDLNAACCASSRSYSAAGDLPDNGFAAALDCRNCIDLFITPNGPGTVTESFGNSGAVPLAEECFGDHLSALTPFGLSQPIASGDINGKAPISSSIPLRC
jgi:hypothetical protein